MTNEVILTSIAVTIFVSRNDEIYRFLEATFRFEYLIV